MPTAVRSLLPLLLAACSPTMHSRPAPLPPPRIDRPPEGWLPIPEAIRRTEPAPSTQLEMRNVYFRFTRRIGLHVRHLRGEMYSRVRDNPAVIMGDKRAFGIRAYRGEVVIAPESLTWLMNEWIFAHPDVPLKRVRATGAGDRLRLTGLMKAGEVAIPFEMLVRAEATPGGLIRLAPTSIKAASVEGKGIMEALDVRLEDVLDLRLARGVRLEGNVMYLVPEQALPPPRMRVRIAEARVERGLLVLQFKPQSEADERRAGIRLTRGPPVGNIIAMRGGTVRFGKLYMVHTDVVMLDADPGDPLDFYLDYYFSQIVEGHAVSEPDYGLVQTVVDYGDLGSGGRESRTVGADGRGAPGAERLRTGRRDDRSGD